MRYMKMREPSAGFTICRHSIQAPLTRSWAMPLLSAHTLADLEMSRVPLEGADPFAVREMPGVR